MTDQTERELDARLMIALALMTGACAPSVVPVAPKPDPSLLSRCERPKPVDINATDNEIALAWVDAVEKYLLCERRQADLARFIKEME